MRIIKIEQQKRKPSRKSIYVNGEFAVGVDEEVFFSFKLEEGMEIEQSLLDEVIHAEEKRKVKVQALNLLSYRARSKKELIDRLKKKGAEVQCINEVVSELEATGLINDNEFAKMWVRERGKSYGLFRLKSELSRKGISNEIINNVLGGLSELEVAQNIAKQWIRRHTHLAPEVLKRRLFSFLARRGINYDTIKLLDVFR